MKGTLFFQRNWVGGPVWKNDFVFVFHNFQNCVMTIVSENFTNSYFLISRKKLSSTPILKIEKLTRALFFFLKR